MSDEPSARAASPAGRADGVRRRCVLVVGGGITGLSAALQLAERPDTDVIVAEAAPELGGKLTTRRVDGFVLDGGPDSLPPGRPDAVRLASALGVPLRPVADSSPPKVLVGRSTRPVPEGMGGFLPKKLGPLAFTTLFSPLGKARMAFDLVIPARRDDGDETLEQFIRRRLGGQAYRRLVEPVTAGILCGDPARVSVLAVMPHLRRAEAAHGGLIKAVVAGRRAAASSPVGARPPAATVAPATGMAEIVEALVVRLRELGADLRTATTAAGLTRDDDRWTVTLGDRDEIVDAVVLAVPAPAASRLLAAVAPEAAGALAAIPQTTLTVVGLGYSPDALTADQQRRLGVGHLVPAGRPGPVRAVWRTSARFPDHAPSGCHLLKVSLEGSLDEARAEAEARAHLARELGVTATPVAVDVRRWDGVMPQYTVGHRERVAAVDQAVAELPGLAVAGSALRGAAIADCVASGRAAADAVLASVGVGVRQ